jgi:hypothetical protein
LSAAHKQANGAFFHHNHCVTLGVGHAILLTQYCTYCGDTRVTKFAEQAHLLYEFISAAGKVV